LQFSRQTCGVVGGIEHEILQGILHCEHLDLPHSSSTRMFAWEGQQPSSHFPHQQDIRLKTGTFFALGFGD
jgi:hypothetical protein